MAKISREVLSYYKKKLVYSISKWDIENNGFNDEQLEDFIWEKGVKPWDRSGAFEDLDNLTDYILDKRLVVYDENLELWLVSERTRKSSFCREYETLYNLDKVLTNTVLKLNQITKDYGFKERCIDDKYFYVEPEKLLTKRSGGINKVGLYKYFYRRLHKEYLNYFMNVEELNDW